ncbi:uncharacterized protein LOC132760176 [Ruditapes philippinarum]|uniref:uncharacterized protein LOC132760176 n=1 Tax=Ruditapes philippinarum TaxID=129788 RepID=UPI00295BF87D|nr:uncharacterized protein LOC132760176 [Ruditapes philippinarum]
MDHGKRKAKAKVDKPLAERKRRARINDALLQLKSIVLQSINNESTMMSKLEKADILEMTVEYIHKMQHFQSTSPANSQLMPGNNAIVFDGLQYTSGFNECTSHVAECMRALPDTDVPDDSIKTRLLEHLVSVASTDDFRNKSKRQDIDPGINERNENVEVNSISTNEMCNVDTNTYAYSNAMLQNNVCNMEHSLNTKNVTETSCTGYLAPQSEILNSVTDGDASYTVLGNVVNNNKNYHYPMYTALHDGLFSIHGEANKVHESLPNEGDNPAFILWPIVQRTENEAVGALNVQESKEENDIYTNMKRITKCAI